jgi:hypothetical protein
MTIVRKLLDGGHHSVYSGTDRLGHIVLRGDGFDAFNRRGDLIGTYPTEQAACNAHLSPGFGSGLLSRFTTAARSRAELARRAADYPRPPVLLISRKLQDCKLRPC